MRACNIPGSDYGQSEESSATTTHHTVTRPSGNRLLFPSSPLSSWLASCIRQPSSGEMSVMYWWTSWWTLALQLSCWAEDLDCWMDLALELTSANPPPHPYSPHWLGGMTVEAAANLPCRPPTYLPL